MSNEPRPGGHVVTLAVTLDHDLGEHVALDVARKWAARAELTPGMTSWNNTRRALFVSGMTHGWTDGADLGQHAGKMLRGVLRSAGATITGWDAVEVLAPHVVEQRLASRAMPPTVDVAAFAQLADVSTSRIRKLTALRRAGERDDFPAELLPGHYLRSEAEHWARTRRTQPGPPPGTPAARTPRRGEVQVS